MVSPQSVYPLLLFTGSLLTGCGGANDSGGDSRELAPLRLTHSPPVSNLDPQQLRSLSMECEKYLPNNSMRGRYDAAYCEQAIAAWGDAPLQLVIITPPQTP